MDFLDFFISKVHTQAKRWFVVENLFAGKFCEPENQSAGRICEPEIQYMCINSPLLQNSITMAELQTGVSIITSAAKMWESSFATPIET